MEKTQKKKISFDIPIIFLEKLKKEAAYNYTQVSKILIKIIKAYYDKKDTIS